MSSFRRVVEILDTAVGGEQGSAGPHGAFWRGIDRDEFVALQIFGLSLIELGDGASSNLVKALRGETPFGTDTGNRDPAAFYNRMPSGGDPVPDAEIDVIEKWIDVGCPVDARDKEPRVMPAIDERIEYRIHPGIGVSRLGTSDNDFLLTSEIFGRAVLPAGNAFWDAQHRLKPQVQRFRIYEYRHLNGRLDSVREITSADAEIEWSVYLVNRKAEAPVLTGVGYSTTQRRNVGVADRSQLIIDPGEAKVSGRRQSVELSGKFKTRSVRLGTIKTDDKGRLLVFAGKGVSGSDPAGEPLRDFANNPNWHDDVADGPVKARLRFAGREPVEADSAWVITAPPSYAPRIDHVTTWCDQMMNLFPEASDAQPYPLKLSFARDIYPILRRVVDLQWVAWGSHRLAHGENGPGNFLSPPLMAKLQSNAPSEMRARTDVFRRLREPNGGGSNMPLLGSGVDPMRPDIRIPASLTARQFEMMQKWAQGEFLSDGLPQDPVVSFEQLDERDKPRNLDCAALEGCIGGPFYPGIEAGYVIARADTYRAPFRLREELAPGYLTAPLAVPWQADFLECGHSWWPAQRPVEVIRSGQFGQFIPDSFEMIDLVENWQNIGVVVPEADRQVHIKSGDRRGSVRRDGIDGVGV